MANKFLDLSGLSSFLDNLKETFSQLGHKHTVSDLEDYQVDSTLSSESENPIQSKAVNNAINIEKTAREAGDEESLKSAKAYSDKNFTTLKSYVDNLNDTVSASIDGANNAIDQKSRVEFIIWEEND